MKTVARSNFTTVTTEGAILPADLLQRVVEGRDLDGLRAVDYGLAQTERLNEAINRSWNRLLGVWEGFQERREALPEDDRGTTLTRDQWLRILFEELGFGPRVPYVASLPISEEEDGQSTAAERYPISHEYERVPIHMVTFRQSLEAPDPDRGEHYRRSPHSLMQEFLNRSDRYLWGIVTNGLRLRLLKDNASFTRPAYLEFDLEAMMDGEVYADFTLLWLVAHASRFQGTPESFLIEKWSQEAARQGTRALDSLRDGVQDAISILGRGFLAYQHNQELRKALQSGDLDKQDYYRQLLRMAYRLIFLFVAEDRDLLLLPDTDATTRERYYDHYSVTHLRKLAERRRSGPHPDLYRTLRLVMEKLREGYEPLGLPALGSFLFSERSTPDLDRAEIANEALLNAIRALAFTFQDGVRRPVDYKNLGAEELGSVYESLLELHPEMNVDAATFELRTAAGNERKTTGSYYTPTSLINSLLETALEPVMEDRLKGKRGKEAEDALLSIRVVDPASGSGHFLIAAANRMARELARLRTGDEEPSPEEQRLALRDVVRHCIYGVDINEMAVELARVALWMETMTPGKPLSFLDANIRHGNSLVGVGPGMDIEEIPYEAFSPATGDHKPTVNALRKRQRKELGGERKLPFEATEVQSRDELQAALRRMMGAIEAMPEDDAGQVHEVEQAYEEYREAEEYWKARLEYDLWTSAFFWPMPKGTTLAPTQEELWKVQDGVPLEPELERRIRQIAKQHDFFHWEIEFPTVFGEDDPGFDVVLGNPPWESVKADPVEFFASTYPELSDANNATERDDLLTRLQEEDAPLTEKWHDYERRIENQQNFFKNSLRFPFGSSGKTNTMPLFTELFATAFNSFGRAGIVVKSVLGTDLEYQPLFSRLVSKEQVFSFYDFINKGSDRPAFFQDVHAQERFALITIVPPSHAPIGYYAFRLTTIEDLGQPDSVFAFSSDDIANMTSGAYRLPPVTERWQIRVLLAAGRACKGSAFLSEASGLDNYIMYDGGKVAGIEGACTAEEFTPTSSDNRFNGLNQQGTPVVGVYESKLFGILDHRLRSFEGIAPEQRYGKTPAARKLDSNKKSDPACSIEPRYWVPKSEVIATLAAKEWKYDWAVLHSRKGNRDNHRTFSVAAVPLCASVDVSPFLIPPNEETNHYPFIAALIIGQSFMFDFLLRTRLIGFTIGKNLLQEIPSPPFVKYLEKSEWQPDISYITWFIPRVLELSYTAYDLRPFALTIGYHGPPFRWDRTRRSNLRCELDAACFHLYGIGRDDVDYIMDTFPIVRRKDEEAHGEYRTKRVILEIYDEMAEAERTGKPYQTRLDPPPADPRAAHEWDEEYLGPELPVDQWWDEVEAEEAPEDLPVEIRGDGDGRATTVEIPKDLDFAPPEGPYGQRLRHVNALGAEATDGNIRELVGALLDEDGNIRYLAGSLLVKHGGLKTVQYLSALLAQEPPEVSREAAERVLSLVTELSGEQERTGPLAQAIAAIKTGDKATGRSLLKDVLENDRQNETAWLWLAAAVDDPARQRQCLEQVLRINPDNERAKKGLAQVE